MVGTILHVVNVDRQSGKGMRVLWLHLAGYLCGAACLGVLLGTLGGILRAGLSIQIQDFKVLLITGLIGLIYSLRESGLVEIPMPSASRQVFSKWRLTLSPGKVALLYGLELGVGLTTYVITATFYVVVVWAILAGDALLGAFTMTFYGLGRALPILWLGWYPTDTEERSRLSDALDRWKPLVHLLNGLALGFISPCLLVSGLSLR